MPVRLSHLLPVILVLLLVACTSTPQTENQPAGKLNVVATNTIVGDIVKNIAGDAVKLSVLIPTDSDPHSFEPVPQDMARVAEADIIFANGAGLEEALMRTIESVGEEVPIVSLSDSIELIQPDGEVHPVDEPLTDEDHEHASGDPHVWTDPNLVKVWVDRIVTSLSEKDPSNATTYQANAEKYLKSLEELDHWIEEQVSQIPPEERKLVTDHQAFAYFARRYGFEEVGAVIPSFSTLAEPSAQELAQLEDAIRDLGVKAIFVSRTVNPALAERVASDTGVKLVYLYSGSLTEPDGEAGSYLDYIRYNVQAIITALQ